MKRIAAFLTLVLLLSFALPFASADGAPSFVVSNAQAHAGDEITITVSLANNPGIASFEYDVNYDHDVLEWTGVTKGSLPGNWDVQVGEAVTWINSDNCTDNGIVTTLIFKVNENAQAQTTTVSVSYDPDNVFDVNADNVSFDVIPGSITVAHTLTKKDAVTASCEAAGNSEYYSCSACGKYFSDEAGTKEIEKDSWVIPATGHKPGAAVRENEKAATCTEEGSYDEVVYCSACQKELSRETKTVAALDHDWGDWIVESEPTCTADGVENRICKHATTHIETRSIPATGHDWGAVTYTWANDNSTVTATRTCGNDASHVETETVNTTYAVTTPATCEADGVGTYTSATFTNTAFAAQSKTVAIPATGHAWGEATYTWSGDNSTVTATRTCGNDSNHVETETVNTSYAVTTAATCEAAGVGTYSATFTNTAFEAQSKTVEIPATGHDWGDWTVTTPATEEAEGVKTRTCKNDSSHTQTDAIPKLDHVHKLVKTEAAAASCETAGNSEYYSCSVCGKYFSDEAGTAEIEKDSWVIPATGHKPGAAVRENEKAATCTEEGSYDEVVYCSACQKELSRETKTVAALGHDWNDWTVTTAPTCTAEGVETHTCKRDASHTETQPVAALGHTWDEGVVTTEPGCTEAGVKTYTCSVCEETKTEEIAALGHKPGEAVRGNEKAATCTEAGSYDEVVYCSVCNAELSRETKTIAALGHDWGEWEDTKESTCYEEGVQTRTCKRDASHTETQPIAKVGHTTDNGTVTQEPTCTGTGVKTYKCSVCQEVLTTEKIPALGHDWGEWSVTTAPTCTAEGVETRTCTRDGSHTETQPVAALGHDWGEWSVTTAPTCTEAGEETRTCKRDGTHTETQPVAALGHDWGEWSVTTAPTCTEAGEETRTCKRDGTHTETQPVAALGHDWGEWSVTTAPTCTEAGEETRTCKRDGTHTETQPVAALGHDWGEGTVTKEPSCTEKGESVYTCSACKETKTEELAALGHQSDAGTVTKAATCTEPGIKTYTCTVCGEVLRTETLPALGHAWDAGKVTKDPTTAEAGKRMYTCQRDNTHVRMEEIPKLAPVPAANSTSPKTGDQDFARLALLLTLGGCGVVMAATLVRKKVRSK